MGIAAIAAALLSAATSQTGAVQGAVERIDPGRGVVDLATSEGRVELSGMPGQLALLHPCETLAVPFRSYGGVRWIATGPLESAGQLGLPGAFQADGTVTGFVGVLDRAQGTMVVRGQPFRVHPELIEHITTGEFLGLTYAEVDGVDWVLEIHPYMR